MSRRDALTDDRQYAEFYEELGQRYPETRLVHGERSLGSRYWATLRELEPFARKGIRMMDLGCNDGVYSLPYCQLGGEALGVDISPTLVRRAGLSAKRMGLPCAFVQADIQSRILPSIIGETFDLAICVEVLEHLLDPLQALRNMRELLNPGGHLLLTTPTPLSGKEGLGSLSMGYAVEVLAAKKLVEHHVVDTETFPMLHEFQVKPTLYRQDNFYPLSFKRLVEAVGFRCVKFGTVSFLSTAARRFAGREGLNLRLELLQRRVPLLNLFGQTNIGIFVRTSW